MMRKLGVTCLFALAVVSEAATITVGTPPGLINLFPFGTPIDPNPGNRYQQVYAASNFAEPVVIEEITFFRVSANNQPTRGTYEIYLSTVPGSIDALSTTDLQSNVGTGNTLFATLDLQSNIGVTLSFTGVPFAYDPASGNLLMDMRISNFTSRGNASLGVRQAPDLFARYHNFSETGGNDGFGLVTQFTIAQAVPEAGTLLYVGVGSFMLGFASVVRRRIAS